MSIDYNIAADNLHNRAEEEYASKSKNVDVKSQHVLHNDLDNCNIAAALIRRHLVAKAIMVLNMMDLESRIKVAMMFHADNIEFYDAYIKPMKWYNP